MINISDFFLGVSLVSVLWAVASAVMISIQLNERGVDVNWIFLRLFIPKYVVQYRDITRKETGRPGALYYSTSIAMIVTVVSAVIGLLLRTL